MRSPHPHPISVGCSRCQEEWVRTPITGHLVQARETCICVSFLVRIQSCPFRARRTKGQRHRSRVGRSHCKDPFELHSSNFTVLHGIGQEPLPIEGLCICDVYGTRPFVPGCVQNACQRHAGFPATNDGLRGSGRNDWRSRLRSVTVRMLGRDNWLKEQKIVEFAVFL